MGGSRLSSLNPEVTSAIVKLFKNIGISIFSTKLLNLFLLSIKEIRRFQVLESRGYVAKAVEIQLPTMR